MSKTNYITVIGDKEENFSFHSSWKDACEKYGWFPKTKRVPSEYAGYKVSKIPVGVTIDCLQLIQFVADKETVIKQTKYDAGYHFHCFNYEIDAYDIFMAYEEKFQEATEEDPEHYFDSLNGVKRVYNIKNGYKDIRVDDWTKKQLCEILIINHEQ